MARVPFEMVARFHDLQGVILERLKGFLRHNLDIRVGWHGHAHGHDSLSWVFFGSPSYGPACPGCEYNYSETTVTALTLICERENKLSE